MITSQANANAGIGEDSSVSCYHTVATPKSWWWLQVQTAVNQSIGGVQANIKPVLQAFAMRAVEH